MKRIVIAAVVLALGTVFAAAQDWPTKLVKIIVPFAAGATPDVVARLIADDLQTRLNQAFIVENRPGATVIAPEFNSARNFVVARTTSSRLRLASSA